ncbi:MAG: flavodoxin family protein [Candidatus Bathyarchaeia archaeon]|jgi:multimeric flavodoxin WrbA
MKAVIFNGAKEGDLTIDAIEKAISDRLTEVGWEVEPIELHNIHIAYCLGCFGCWLKTPGECVIKDAGHDLARKVIESDVVFLLTSVTFGMYSSELKKAMDRFPCPVLLPFFKKVNGEIHHSNRYNKYPTLVAIGVMSNSDEESEKTFTTLVGRNGINLHTKAISSIVYSGDKPEDINEKVKSTLCKVGFQ